MEDPHPVLAEEAEADVVAPRCTSWAQRSVSWATSSVTVEMPLPRRTGRQVAALAARLHVGGVVHPDLKPVNLLVRCYPGGKGAAAGIGVDLALIDLDRVRLRPRVSRRMRLLNLIQLHGSVQQAVPYRERFLFLRHYQRCGGPALSRKDLRYLERGAVDWMGKRRIWPEP